MTEFYAYPTDHSCYYYVVCDVRREANYYYCGKSNTWLKNDFLNCSHYPDLDSIPSFSVETSVIKIYLMMEYVCDKKRKSSY